LDDDERARALDEYHRLLEERSRTDPLSPAWESLGRRLRKTERRIWELAHVEPDWADAPDATED
jgi:hypothetical protein